MTAQNAEDPITWGEALLQESEWYKSTEAIRIADNVLLYQHESGGWPKNIDMAKKLSEQKKQLIRTNKSLTNSSLNDITIDNGATISQIKYLAKVYTATERERFKNGVLKGIDYLLQAQYNNGGWPQYYPIRNGYYEHITFNDGAMIGAMQLLRDVANEEKSYSFVDADRKEKSTKAIEKGLDIILKTQVEVDGKLTTWCAQYDRETLEPAAARTYELISLSGSESVGIVYYLMGIEEPDSVIINAINSAVVWFDKVKLTDVRIIEVEKPDLPKGFDRVVGFDPTGESPLWARFYEIGTNYPMFVDREGTVHYALSEIPYERRVGYSWLGNYAEELLEKDYPKWLDRIQ